jgi:excisionase family DNA binding protein
MAQRCPDLVTVAEVAESWRVPPARVYQLARDGVLPGVVRIGRLVRLDVARLREWAAAGGRSLAGSRICPTVERPDDAAEERALPAARYARGRPK